MIGADSLSRYVDWTDRGTCILFGDAAGAVVVQVIISPSGFLFLEQHKMFVLALILQRITIQACDNEEDGLFGFDLHSDGDGQRF